MTSLLLLASLLSGRAPLAGRSPSEVPFEIHSNAIVVNAAIKGHPLKMIFDTGFSGDAVIDSTVDLGKPTGKTTLRDFVGQFDADYYTVNEMSLGDHQIKAPGLEVIKQEGISEFGSETHIDGLMGFSLIKDLVTEINFQNNKFIFHPDSEDISKRVPDNVKTFLLPMEPIGNRAIVLKVTTPDGKLMNMTLDTGNAFYATTHKDVLIRLGLWKESQDPKFTVESGVASGAVTSWYKDLKNMTVFGVKVPDATWDIIDLPASSAESDGTVGYEFLKNFNVTLDFKRRYVWLENFTGKAGNTPDGGTGLSAWYFKELKSTIVTRVAPDSPADKAGIKRGDTLIDIDDNDLTSVSPKALRDMLIGPVGTKMKVSFSHQGISQRVTLVREALVNP